MTNILPFHLTAKGCRFCGATDSYVEVGSGWIHGLCRKHKWWWSMNNNNEGTWNGIQESKVAKNIYGDYQAIVENLASRDLLKMQWDGVDMLLYMEPFKD